MKASMLFLLLSHVAMMSGPVSASPVRARIEHTAYVHLGEPAEPPPAREIVRSPQRRLSQAEGNRTPRDTSAVVLSALHRRRTRHSGLDALPPPIVRRHPKATPSSSRAPTPLPH
jgi:hypothetical protein